MPYVTDSSVDKIISLPFSCPETQLKANTSLFLSTVYIPLGYVLRARYLSVNMISATRVASQAQYLVNPYYNLVFAGLYSGEYNELHGPTGAPIYSLNVSNLGTTTSFYTDFSDFSSPDYYTLILVNNTFNFDYNVTVSCALKLYGTA